MLDRAATRAAGWEMPRGSVWVQLLIGWLPIWALYSVMIATAHATSANSAAWAGLRAITVAALLGVLVHRLARRFPWPRTPSARWIGLHLLSALAYALTWIALTLGSELSLGVLHGSAFDVRVTAARVPVIPFVVLGIWLYAMVAAVAYATQSTERAARAEALAAESRLAALRAQLDPHFLFNALHTVMQLIPVDPRRASEAAERLGELLRSSLEEERDFVPLDEEWRFVERYLALERLRFGDRLQVTMEMDDRAREAQLPAFALQTLVENAVRHGASPREAPTELHVSARADERRLSLVVRDDGVGADPAIFSSGEGRAGDARTGTGLARLRGRLAVLFGDRGRLTIDTRPGAGLTARLDIPYLEEAPT